MKNDTELKIVIGLIHQFKTMMMDIKAMNNIKNGHVWLILCIVPFNQQL